MSHISILKMRAALLAAAAFDIAAVCTIAGCGSGSPQTIAAHKIADRLPKIIGSARHYDVEVDGDPFALGRGRAKRIVIDGQSVEMASGLTMDRLTIEADDVSFDVKKRTLEHIGRVSFKARLGQINLDKYIARIKPDMPGLSIKLQWDDMDVAVPVKVASITTTARVSGTLSANRSGPDKLDFTADKASIGIVPLPAKLVNIAIDHVNPVLDLSGVRFPISISGAYVDRGSIILRGTATIDKV
jgi:hypothetical protein